MIIPANRLLWLVGLLFFFSLLTLGVEEGTTLFWLVALLGALVGAGDLLWARSKGELLRIETPDVLRLTRNRDGEIPLGLRTLQAGVGDVRLGILLPPELASAQDELWVGPGEEVNRYEAGWKCRPSRCGKYQVDQVSWQVASPLGLWRLTSRSKCRIELRVYPDLSKELKSVAAFFLNRGMFGLHAHRMVGRGREFERLREYMPGDSYDEIHWKATARRGTPITKIFQVERTQEVYVVIDASRLSARIPASRHQPDTPGAVPENTLDRYVSASLVLAMAAEKQGDHFGLLAFGGQVKRFLRAGSGKAHFNACRDALYTLQAEPVAPDLSDVFTFLRTRLRKRALLVFLTSLEDPLMEENFVSQVDFLARKHLVMVNMIRPDDAGRLFCAREAPASKDDLYRRLAGHLHWHDLRETGNKLKRFGVQFSLLENEQLSPELVSRYMMVKQRQLV